jgi:hypothetical protein
METEPGRPLGTNAPRGHARSPRETWSAIVCPLGPFAAPFGAEGYAMLNAASALPAGPGEREDDVFPIRERIRLRDNFGLALLELRARNAEFQRLGKGAWALFIGIAVHRQGNAEAWPSQNTLGRFSGWWTRAVRDQADSLERAGFIRVRRERRTDGSERIFYAPGLVTLAALANFVERFPARSGKGASPRRAADKAGGAYRHPPTGSSFRGTQRSRSEQTFFLRSSACQRAGRGR